MITYKNRRYITKVSAFGSEHEHLEFVIVFDVHIYLHTLCWDVAIYYFTHAILQQCRIIMTVSTYRT